MNPQVHLVSDGTQFGAKFTVNGEELEVVSAEWRQRWGSGSRRPAMTLEIDCPAIDVVAESQLYTTIGGKRYRLVEDVSLPVKAMYEIVDGEGRLIPVAVDGDGTVKPINQLPSEEPKMTTRACIVTCTHETAVYLQVGKIRLPDGVRFAAMRECFDRAGSYEVRLAGEGIPESQDGDLLPKATLVTLPSGEVAIAGLWELRTPLPAGTVSITEGANL